MGLLMEKIIILVIFLFGFSLNAKNLEEALGAFDQIISKEQLISFEPNLEKKLKSIISDKKKSDYVKARAVSALILIGSNQKNLSFLRKTWMNFSPELKELASFEIVYGFPNKLIQLKQNKEFIIKIYKLGDSNFKSNLNRAIKIRAKKEKGFKLNLKP